MMMHIAPCIILWVVSVCGTIGNLGIIFTIGFTSFLRVRTYTLIFNLAVVDLVVTGYIMPIGLLSSQRNDSVISGTHCKINAFLMLLTLGVSTTTLMIIAVERYLHVCWTNMYNNIFTPKGLCVIVALIWIYSGAICSAGWWSEITFQYIKTAYICVHTQHLAYNLVLAFFGMILQITVIIICYTRIFLTVRRSRQKLKRESVTLQINNNPILLEVHKGQKKNLNKEYKLTITVFTVFIVFFLFWIPTAIFLSVNTLDIVRKFKFLYPLFLWLSLSNSAVNCIIYGIMNNNFRSGYKLLLHRIFCNSSKCRPSTTTSSSLEQDGSVDNKEKRSSNLEQRGDNSDVNTKQENVRKNELVMSDKNIRKSVISNESLSSVSQRTDCFYLPNDPEDMDHIMDRKEGLSLKNETSFSGDSAVANKKYFVMAI